MIIQILLMVTTITLKILIYNKQKYKQKYKKKYKKKYEQKYKQK
jgi:hypothetical protein